MDPTIKDILKSTYTDGVFHTHVSMMNPKGKFQFNRHALETFWDTYCTILDKTEDPQVGIAEKPMQYLPVLVDVDLKIRDEGQELSDTLYTEDQLKAVVETYQSVLRYILDKCTDEELNCVVLEKNMYTETKNEVTYIKNGFHLHFPYIFLNKIDQEVQLIPRVQEKLKDMKLFDNLGFEDSGEVIDRVCCKVPWLLYGSKKGPGKQPYLVTKVYNANMEEVSLEQAFKHYHIFDKDQQIIPLKGKVKHYLPRILSIVPAGRPTRELKRGIISPIKEKLKKERKSSVIAYRNMTLEETLSLARKLLSMVSDSRADDRQDWMTVGWVLFNVTDGHPDALELWCEFSARCEDKYDENVCVHEWEKMVKRSISMGTLRHFAKQDNPAEYAKMKKEKGDAHALASLDGSHNDIAKLLFEEYGDEFICASVTNKIWYQFIGHRWEQIEDGIFLREKISGKIIQRYVEIGQSLYQESAKETDKGRQAMINTKMKQVNKIIQNLKSAPYKKNVMIECGEVFYDPNFKDRLDADPYLIAFKNGVYDLRENIFRPGRPEDYLSKNMPINYINYTEDDEKVQEIYTFLEQIFPDKSVRKYFLDVSSDIFVGGNHEKIVVFWTGEGDNGKSVVQSFFEKMMGKLAIKLNTNIITGKKPSAGSAFADLARAGGGVRWAVLEEPDGDETINSGILKHMSGNDSFYARDLFERGKDGREIQPMFKLIFITNKLPRIKYADKAVWNRVRVIPFEATFCRSDNPAPETYEEQLRQKRFPMDKHFAKKIPGLVEAFAWVLIQHRTKILGKPREEPPKVMSATELYKKQNDIYRQFLEEEIIEDEKKSMSLTELYDIFKNWFRESLPGQSLPVKNEVEEYFVRLWGTPGKGKKWSGYRKRTTQDDVVTIPMADEDGNIIQVEENNEDDVNVRDEDEINPLLR